LRMLSEFDTEVGLRLKRCGCSERVCVIEEKNCERGEGFIVVLLQAKE
jgi:hypothetical protein